MSDSGNPENGASNLPAIEQPRPARNLQQLLRYAVEAGGANAIIPALFEDYSAERRRFLEEALSSLTVDTAKYLYDNIQVLRHVGETRAVFNDAAYQGALINIADIVDNIDAANDFCKIGGFEIVPQIMAHVNDECRLRMADILGQCAQNNPFCQAKAVSMEFVPLFLSVADRDTDHQVRTKAMFAVAAIVRDCPEALKQFINCDGFSIILKGLQSGHHDMCTKATFFMASLISKNPEIKEDLFKMGYVEQFILLLRGPHSRNHEYISSALLSLIQDYPEAQDECRRPEFEFHALLQSLITEYSNDEAFQEEIGNEKQLMSLLFADTSEEER